MCHFWVKWPPKKCISITTNILKALLSQCITQNRILIMGFCILWGINLKLTTQAENNFTKLSPS
jgi:hypothetical protein